MYLYITGKNTGIGPESSVQDRACRWNFHKKVRIHCTTVCRCTWVHDIVFMLMASSILLFCAWQCTMYMCLNYYYMVLFVFSPKITVHVVPAPESKPPGPCTLQKANFLRLSFRKGGQEEVNVQYIVYCTLHRQIKDTANTVFSCTAKFKVQFANRALW